MQTAVVLRRQHSVIFMYCGRLRRQGEDGYAEKASGCRRVMGTPPRWMRSARAATGLRMQGIPDGDRHAQTSQIEMPQIHHAGRGSVC